jgi:exoribonuclease-2
MLAEDTLPVLALGLSEKSFALTFRIIIDENGNVVDTEIFPSIVKVKRITYKEADIAIDNVNTEDAEALRALYYLSMKIHKRRIANGAINIELPDVHITVKNGNVKIDPVVLYRSASLVRECMITAGEGAGTWAAERGIAFPYISQEVEIQGGIHGGLAGSWQLRRCMRPRVFSTKPGCHQGLGLDIYTQVTSPLRRYTDLLAHLQIRAVLRGETPLGADEVSARLGFSEAAVTAVVQAERASNNHWLMVYLKDKKDSIWDAVAIERKGNRTQIIIPSLALETQVSLQKDVLPNEDIKLTLKSVNIPRGEAVFITGH